MKLLPALILAVIASSTSGYAQKSKTDTLAVTPKPGVFRYVEHMPVAGYNINEYLANSIKYPVDAIKANVEGRVIIKFVVNEDGSVTDVSVVHGIGGGCDEEAARVVRAMPNWRPGQQDGKPVKVYFTLPINFKLEDPEPAKPVDQH
jgi:periplasmic protein TonB